MHCSVKIMHSLLIFLNIFLKFDIYRQNEKTLTQKTIAMDQNSSFDFKKFIDDSKETLINPKSYFASMPLGGGMGEPLIKALIYSVVAAVFTLIWSFVVVGGVAGGVFGGGYRDWETSTSWKITKAIQCKRMTILDSGRFTVLFLARNGR